MKLTKIERLILFNQYLILKKLEEIKPSGSDSYHTIKDLDKKLDILSNGFEYEYDDNIISQVMEPIPSEIQRFVRDVLGMFDCIMHSMEALSEESKNEIEYSHNLHFFGFDGNEEIPYKSYLDFLRKHNFYTPVFKYYDEGTREFNSHMNKVPDYKIMLEKHQNMKADPNTGLLTLEQLKELANIYE